MYKEVWNKYVKGFKFLLPFVLIQVLCASIGFSLNFGEKLGDSFSLSEGANLTNNLVAFKEGIMNNFTPVLIALVAGTLFFSVLMAVIKSVMNEEYVSYSKSFKNGIGYYFKYLVLDIVISAISLAIMLVGFWGILTPFAFIAMLYLAVVLTPCVAYLVYHNASPMESLKKGMILGKKHFGEILFIGIALSVLPAIAMALANNVVANVCIRFVTINVWIYMSMFAMDICKREETGEIKSHKKILEY